MVPRDALSTRSDLSEPRSSSADFLRGRQSRRAVLAAVGSATGSSLAGCSMVGSGSETGPFRDGDWLSYGNGPTNSNHVGGGAPPLEDHSVLTSAQWPYAPPVLHDGRLYFASDYRVTALALDGTERWTTQLEVEVAGAIAVDPDRDRLYVPTRVVPTRNGPDPAPAFVTGLSLADGEIIAAYPVGDRSTYGVTVSEGDVYVRSATACVRLAPDGTERWRQPLEPLVYEEYNLGDTTATQIAPAVGPKGVYVPDRNALVKLDPASGVERWRVSVDTPYAASVIDEGRGVVQTGWQETVAADTSGDVRWRRDLHSRAAAAIAGGDVYVVASDLHELDPTTGETTWQTHLPGEGTAAPVVTDEDVLVATGNVQAFRRDASGIFAPDRERWRISSVHAATFSSPVIAAGRVFVVGPWGLLSLQSGDDGE